MRATIQRILCGAALASLTACGGGGGSGTGSTMAASATGTVPLVVSDASSEDWATIGVKILSIALTPQGGGSPVTVYTAASPAPMINLAQLDQIGEILGNVSVPVGTYTGATITVSANPSDVLLVASAEPEAGFAGTAGATVPAAQIQVQGAKGSQANATASVSITFQTPLTVTTTSSNALDLEFDLSHPVFLVDHVPPTTGTTIWALDFNGPIRHRRVADITRLVLRHSYGTVTQVSSDNSAITITKVLPALPVQTPESSVTTSQSLQILADATNGTLFYDVDAKTSTVIKTFATEGSGLAGKYVRIAARYQQNGTLVATRIWASSTFNSVWVSPEGHVLHADITNNTITVANEAGQTVQLVVNANTQFFFRTPEDAQSDTTPIATGTGFLASHNLVRGFKIHASVVDPLATPLVAQTVDIETAAYQGRISNADTTGFTYTRNFLPLRSPQDDYTMHLDYISSSSANGKDAQGNAITGFKWWDFAYPTLVTSGSNAVNDFVAAPNGGVNFGGTVGSVAAWGFTSARWNDPANSAAWTAPHAVLMPTPMPLGTVSVGFAANTFSMTVAAGTSAASVDVSTTSGSATLVYQVDRTNGIVTVSPVDITTSAGLNALTTNLVTGTRVKVYGTPQADGTLKAYALTYFTGDKPSM